MFLVEKVRLVFGTIRYLHDINSIKISSVIAVSYTHLDVYKRQQDTLCKICDGNENFLRRGYKKSLRFLYKEQIELLNECTLSWPVFTLSKFSGLLGSNIITIFQEHSSSQVTFCICLRVLLSLIHI